MLWCSAALLHKQELIVCKCYMLRAVQYKPTAMLYMLDCIVVEVPVSVIAHQLCSPSGKGGTLLNGLEEESFGTWPGAPLRAEQCLSATC